MTCTPAFGQLLSRWDYEVPQMKERVLQNKGGDKPLLLPSSEWTTLDPGNKTIDNQSYR